MKKRKIKCTFFYDFETQDTNYHKILSHVSLILFQVSLEKKDKDV